MPDRKLVDMTDIIAHASEVQPETAEQLVNKYGTYNIQPTSVSGNKYPAIAQKQYKLESKKDN